MMDFVLLGIHFRSAPLAVRERLSVPAAELPERLRAMQPRLPDAELMLLPTCNRCELYAAAPRLLDPDALRQAFLDPLGASEPDILPYLYLHRGREAVTHLLVVASSLDSLVIGETEILGQVKQAYQAACEAGSARTFLHAVCQHAFRAAKRVYTETDLARGRVSVGSIAVDLAGKVFADLEEKVVLAIGVGEIGRQAVRCLASRGVRELLVANRSPERAAAVAAECGGRAIPFESLAETLPLADVVVSSTTAPDCILHADTVRQAMARRRNRPMLFVDLAVPRDVEEAVGRIENVYLYTMDDLAGMAEVNAFRRREAIEDAHRIVAAEAAALTADLEAGAPHIGELMKALDDTAARILETELDRAFAKETVAPFGEPCEHCREQIRIMLHRALAKMTAGPKTALREAARSEEWDTFARVASRLYHTMADTNDRDADPE
ncbi:MAG: glutamyl-tRNA reductase [Lentisphaeria bacterium]|nr:glutamyl-tRNA reductase [Lentisphaeria bacterium]